MHSKACVTNSLHRTTKLIYSRRMRNGGIKALCAIIVLLSGCAVEEPVANVEALRAAPLSDEPVHALVRFGRGRSELMEEGSGLLWGVSAEEAGGEGWYLVFLPPAYLQQLRIYGASADGCAR